MSFSIPKFIRKVFRLSKKDLKMFFTRERKSVWFFIIIIGFPTVLFFSDYVIANRSQINKYLIEISNNTQGQLFNTIGGSIFTALAITFSLAIFSIQYASEKGTSKILIEYRNDPVYKISFWLMAFFATAIFLFSLLPLIENWIFIEYLVTFIFLISTFIILFKVFNHTIDLVNPLYGIQLLYKKVEKYFSDISKNINNMIERGDVSLKTKGVSLEDLEEKELLTTGVFRGMPQIMNYIRQQTNEIFDFIREYAPRRKYDITIFGYKTIAAIVGVYFKTRKRSTEFSNIFSFETDPFLIYIYEKLTELNRIHLQFKDLEGMRQNLNCFHTISLHAINFEPVPALKTNDNFTCSMAVGYMVRNVLDGIKIGLDDVGLDCARALCDIGDKISPKYYLTINGIINHLYKIALSGIGERKFYIVDECTNGMMHIYNKKMDLKKYRYSQTTIGSNILEKLKHISIYYLEYDLEISVNCYGLGPIFNILDNKSFPNFLIKYLSEVSPIEFDNEIITDSFQFYYSIAEKAGEKESFLIHFIIQGIYNVINSALDIFSEKKNKEKYNKILDELIWLLSVYWRIYKKQPKDYKKNYIYLFGMDNLTALSLKSIKLGFKDFAKEVCNQILTIASIAIKKKEDEFTAPRTILNLIKIGIFARAKKKNLLADYIVDKVEEFYGKFIQYHKEKGEIPEGYFDRYKESLSREMWRMYTDLSRYRPIGAFESDYYLGEIGKKDIKNYLNEIEFRIYKRKVDKQSYETRI